MQVRGEHLNLNVPNVWKSGDSHFGHTNIIKYVERPYAYSQEMDGAIVQNWNSVVDPEDIVFHHGDFALPDRRIYPTEKEQNDYTANIIKSLNGKIIIIFGSHDKHAYQQKHLFFRYHHKNTIAEYYIDNYCVLMSHVPLLSWEKRAHGSLHSFGHVHSGPKKPFPCSPGSYDVGLDNNNFFPIPFSEFVKNAQSPIGKLNLDIYDNVVEEKI